MLDKFAALLWLLFGGVCPLYDQVLKLWRVLSHPSLKSVKSKFTRIRCAHITWQVLEETRLFFDQRLGPNDFMNNVPRRFPTDDLGGLIEDVRRNKLLDSVTMPRQWNNHQNCNTWATHNGKGQGGNMQANVFFPGAAQRPTDPDPYSTQAGNGNRYQTPQWKGW